MPYASPKSVDRKRAIVQSRHLIPGAAAFAAMAGYINSVALGFFQSPVSHMTGTVSYFGINLARGRLGDSLLSLEILLGFLAGAVAGGLIVGAESRLPGRRHSIAMMAEAILLFLSMILLLGRHGGGTALASMACGLQNAATSSYCGLIIRTTHLTGTITDIGVMIGHWIRHRQIEAWKLWFMSLLVVAFGAGVFAGAIANSHWGPAGLGLPAAASAIAGVVLWIASQRGWIQKDFSSPEPPVRI